MIEREPVLSTWYDRKQQFRLFVASTILHCRQLTTRQHSTHTPRRSHIVQTVYVHKLATYTSLFVCEPTPENDLHERKHRN